MAPGPAFPSERKVMFMRLGSGVVDGGSFDNVKAFQQVLETRVRRKRTRFDLYLFDQRGTG
jgi:hypothetical protein